VVVIGEQNSCPSPRLRHMTPRLSNVAAPRPHSENTHNVITLNVAT
jgi:hypothetical protein